jgi:hypothetical protein
MDGSKTKAEFRPDATTGWGLAPVKTLPLINLGEQS